MESAHRCKSILIVEDDVEISETLTQLLQIEGYQPSHAANGKEALELLKKIGNPCLILLDLMMPVMNGWEFLSVIKSNPNHSIATIPVLIVSAVSEIAGSARFQAEGFIKKPFELDMLLNAVKKYCG